MKPATRHALDTTERKAIGQRLRAARHKAGVSSSQAAQAVGLSHRQTITGYEAGYMTPSLACFADLCRLYGVSMDKTFHGEPAAKVVVREPERTEE